MVIPVDAGFVALTENTVISTLKMSGGALVTHDTTCLSGWSPAPGGISSPFGSSKCYRVFRGPKSWAEAQNACATAVGAGEMGTRGGALRGSLVTVQGLEENQWVQRLCKGGDCWMGMTRDASATDLEWVDLEMTEGDSRYRSWARREPSVFDRDEVSTPYRGCYKRLRENSLFAWCCILTTEWDVPTNGRTGWRKLRGYPEFGENRC